MIKAHLPNTHRKVAALLSLLSLLMWSTGAPGFINRSYAGVLSFVSDTLSNSGPSAASNHTIVFHNTTAVASGQSVAITFPSGFNLTALSSPNDFDMATTSDSDLVASGANSSQWNVAVNAQTITFTSGGSGAIIPANSTTTIKIGTNASYPATPGVNRIINPTSGSYIISIGGTQADHADTNVMILNNVVASAVVGNALTFTVSGVAGGQQVNSASTTVLTATSSTATALSFETLTPGVKKNLAQDLSVTTNAPRGFSVTIEADGALTSSSGATIDPFIDGAGTPTPVSWQSPDGSVGFGEKGWGHEGITSDDADLNGGEFGDGANTIKYAGNFSTTTRTLFSSNGPADGVTQNLGKARIGYTVEITPMQEAGGDYTQILTYICTPVF